MTTKPLGEAYCGQCRRITQHTWIIPVGGRGALPYCDVCRSANHDLADLRRSQRSMVQIRGEARTEAEGKGWWNVL